MLRLNYMILNNQRSKKKSKENSRNILKEMKMEVYHIKTYGIGEILHEIPYMQNLKRNNTKKLTYKTDTQSLEKVWDGGRDRQGLWEGHVLTAIFQMDKQQRHTVQYMELRSMSCGSLDAMRVCGRMDTCICMAEYLCSSPETITTLLISYTPIQN